MSEQRDKQLLVVYTVVVVVVLYYAITYWLPFIQQSLALYNEKSRVLKTIEGEINSDEFDVKELAEYKSKKSNLKEESDKKSQLISPNFVLEKTLVERTVQQQEPNQPAVTNTAPKRAIAPKFNLPVHASRVKEHVTVAESVATEGRVVPPVGSSIITTQSAASNTSTTSQPTRYLGAFAQDSIEAQLHQSLARRGDPFGIENLDFDPHQLQREAQQETARLVQERGLREQQDLEYQQSLQRDLSAQKLEDETKLMEDRTAARRLELTQLLKEEPEVGAVGCITLSFRSRQPLPAFNTTTSSASTSTNNMRIQRRFLCTQHTAEDVLLFIESLELRPLCSPAALSCVLTLDFPTRVLSRETEKSKTLAELGIETDSVVWVRFEED